MEEPREPENPEAIDDEADAWLDAVGLVFPDDSGIPHNALYRVDDVRIEDGRAVELMVSPQPPSTGPAMRIPVERFRIRKAAPKDPGAALLADIDAAIGEAKGFARIAGASMDDASQADPLAMLGNARALAAEIEKAFDDPTAAVRLRRGAYHLAGLLDALGVSPRKALAIVAQGVVDHHESRGPAES